MQGLLLDTHVWLWYVEGMPDLLSTAVLDAVEAARMNRRLYVSTISVWEIGMQVAKGRISLSVPVDDWVFQASTQSGTHLQPLDAQSALESTRLPGNPHNDPADRFLMATARVHGLRLVTADGKINEYARAGYLDVLRA